MLHLKGTVVSIHHFEVGNFHDNNAVLDMAVSLLRCGRYEDARHLLGILQKHIHATHDAKSRLLLLPHVEAHLSTLQQPARTMIQVVPNRARRNSFPGSLAWFLRHMRLLLASRAAAFTLYYGILFVLHFCAL